MSGSERTTPISIIGMILLVATACWPHNDGWEPGRSTVPIPKAAGERELRTCASDLTCPLGFVCAKKAAAFTGECLLAVDENGAPVEVPHSVESYGPGPQQCWRTTDCPGRFRCDEGRCVL